MTLVWEQEGENSGGLWGLYDDGNFVGEVYPLGDCFRWRDEVSNARRIEPSLAAARSACQARYEGEKALLTQRGQWPPRWLPWNDREDQAAYEPAPICPSPFHTLRSEDVCPMYEGWWQDCARLHGRYPVW